MGSYEQPVIMVTATETISIQRNDHMGTPLTTLVYQRVINCQMETLDFAEANTKSVMSFHSVFNNSCAQTD